MQVSSVCGSIRRISTQLGKYIGSRKDVTAAKSADLIRFDAFASYATNPDRDLVRAAEDFIETLHRERVIPKPFRRKLELCVDGQDFSVSRPSEDAPRTLQELMVNIIKIKHRESRCLFVFSGETTKTHFWINTEINLWREQPNYGPIYFVLTHGEIKPGDPEIPQNLLPEAFTDDSAGLCPLWFDLREYHRRRRRRTFWRSPRFPKKDPNRSDNVRNFDEELFRMTVQILSLKLNIELSPAELKPRWEALLRARKRFRLAILVSAVLGLAIGAVIADRELEAERLDAIKIEARTAVADQDYEHALKAILQGLPLDGDFFWRRGWSSVEVKELLAALAGAAQMSAYVGRVKNDEFKSGDSGPVREPFQAVAFDGKGDRIVAASQGGSVAVWDRSPLRRRVKCVQTSVFSGFPHSGAERSMPWVRDARFAYASDTVLSVGPYGAWLWNPSAGCDPKALMVRGHRADVRTGAFSPDEDRVVTTSDDETVLEWDASTGANIGAFALPPPELPRGYRYTIAAEYSRKGGKVAIARRDGLIAVFDAQTHAIVSKLQNAGPSANSLSFDKEGARVLSSLEDGRVVIWDVASAKAAAFFRQPSGVGKARFSPDERFVLTSSLDNVARLWDVESRQQVFAFKGHSRPVVDVAFRPDGKEILTASDDGTARLWALGPSITPATVAISKYAIVKSAVSNAGDRVAFATLDGRIAVFDFLANGVLTGREDIQTDEGEITSLSFGPDGDSLLIATERGAVRNWRRGSDRIEVIDDIAGADTFAARAPDAKTLAIASAAPQDAFRPEARLLPGGRTLALAGAWQMTGIEFSRDGGMLVGGSAQIDGEARLALVWDARTGSKKFALKNSGHVLSAHFSPDGSRIATSTIDRKAYIWDAGAGRQLHLLTGHTYNVNSARFSLDGARLATASSDRTVRVWDVATGALILQFPVGQEANDAVFSRDGQRLLVVGKSGEVFIFDVSWTVTLDATLKERTCREKLPDIDENGVCARVGLFSLSAWRQWLTGASK